MNYTHVTAPTRYVETNAIRFAYRRFGKESGVPLLFLQHFRGGMDHWDPIITDGFAQERPVILFDYTGVARSSGETPDTFDTMAEDSAHFIRALGLSQVDVLGFSIGGYVAQTLVLHEPALVRRLILVGTGPRAGEPPRDPKVLEHARGNEMLEDFLYLFFSPSARSQAEGRSKGGWEPVKGDDQPGSVRWAGITRQALVPGKTPMRTLCSGQDLLSWRLCKRWGRRSFQAGGLAADHFEPSSSEAAAWPVAPKYRCRSKRYFDRSRRRRGIQGRRRERPQHCAHPPWFQFRSTIPPGEANGLRAIRSV